MSSFDFRANQVRTNALIASGSQMLFYPSGSASNMQGGIGFATENIGTDVFCFVSGAVGGKDVGNHGATLFGGDLVVSGNFHSLGTSYFRAQSNFTGNVDFYYQVGLYGVLNSYANAKFNSALSGSLQCLATGEPYLLAGPNITIVTNSFGQVAISGSGGGSAPPPCYIPISSHTTIDATMGTVQVGAIPSLFNPADYNRTGYTLDLTLELVGFTGNNRTATYTLYDETNLTSVCICTITSSTPSASVVIPTFVVGTNLYTANLSVSGSTTSDFAIVANAALVARWH